MKRGVFHLIFINENNKEELKDSSLIIVLTNKNNALNWNNANERIIIIDVSFIGSNDTFHVFEPDTLKLITGKFDSDNSKKTDKQ